MARLSLPTVPSSRGSCFRHCYTPSFPGDAELHHPQLRRAPALVWASRLSEALAGSQVLQAERARAPGRGGAGRGVVTLPLVLGPGRGRGSVALTPHPPALAALACWGQPLQGSYGSETSFFGPEIPGLLAQDVPVACQSSADDAREVLSPSSCAVALAFVPASVSE